MKYQADNNGQELVEFALILPIMIGILVVISELGFSWTLKGIVSDAIKSSVQEMKNFTGQDEATAQNIMTTKIKNYLNSHNVPNTDSVSIEFSDPNVSEHTTVNVAYEYIPSFTLPNIMGISALPAVFSMSSSQIINSAVLKPNNYNSGDVNMPVAVNPSDPNSILKDDPTPGSLIRQQVIFLIDLPGKVDRLVNWWGHDILPASVGVNAETGKFIVKTPYNSDVTGGAFTTSADANGWKISNESYADLLLVQGYTTLFYADAKATGTNIDSVELPGYPNIYNNELGAISWCTPVTGGGTTCDGDISTTLSTSLMAKAINLAGQGYEIVAPIPSTASASQLPLPSNNDDVYRDVIQAANGLLSLKIFVPKAVNGSSFISPTTISDLSIQADRELVMQQSIDADADGISAFWDLAPNDPDEDKNLVLDGYQLPSSFTAPLATYPTNGWAVDGAMGEIPTVDVIYPVLNVADNTYISPISPLYADSTCAAFGCVTNEPFFLKSLSKYKTSSGVIVRTMREDAQRSNQARAEKYFEPSVERELYKVEIITRDLNSNGTIEIAGGDDGNADGLNDGSNSDSINYNGTQGIISLDKVDANYTGGKSFASVSSFDTLDYMPIDPNTAYVSIGPFVSVLSPANKATITSP